MLFFVIIAFITKTKQCILTPWNYISILSSTFAQCVSSILIFETLNYFYIYLLLTFAQWRFVYFFKFWKKKKTGFNEHIYVLNMDCLYTKTNVKLLTRPTCITSKFILKTASTNLSGIDKVYPTAFPTSPSTVVNCVVAIYEDGTCSKNEKWSQMCSL